MAASTNVRVFSSKLYPIINGCSCYSWKLSKSLANCSRRYADCAYRKYDHNARDPAPIFFSGNVQKLLQRLTGLNYDKIFRRRYEGSPLQLPKYEFLTTEQLEEKMAQSRLEAEHLLQMPPVLREHDPIDRVLNVDPALTTNDDFRYVFTDISYGISNAYFVIYENQERFVVVREPNGTLRMANSSERVRMNQIYNPRVGCKMPVPLMFSEEHLQNVLERGVYQFVLDRACLQFDPDSEEFQRVAALTYEAVDAKGAYDVLHSTRHYGPFCFYLAWNRKLDSLMIHLIEVERLADAADLVRLFCEIHSDTKVNLTAEDDVELIQAYIESECSCAPKLQLTLRKYLDLVREKQRYTEAVKKAHGS